MYTCCVDQNPFQAPAVDEPSPLAASTTYKLYSPQAVGIATFLASAFGGGWVLGKNYKRIGEPQKAWLCFFGGLGVTLLIMLGGLTMPDGVASVFRAPLHFGLIWLSRSLAKSWQGAAFERHRANGGAVASNWGAVGISALALVLLVVVGSCAIVVLDIEA